MISDLDNEVCKYYERRKTAKKKTLSLFENSLAVFSNNLVTYFYIALTYCEMGKIDDASFIMNMVMEKQQLQA